MSTPFRESPEVLNYVDHEAISDPVKTEVIAHERQLDSELLGGIQQLTFGVAEPEAEPHSVILMPVSWSDYSDRPFQKLRLGTMAKYTGARVIGIDMPGMGTVDGTNVDPLSEKQAEQMRAGRMTDLAQGYWEALTSQGLMLDDNDKQLPVVLWGNSLSTLTVAEMAATAPEKVKVQDVMLSESMAVDSVHPLKLGLRFAVFGGTKQPAYLAMNEGTPAHESSGLLGLAKQVASQRQSHLLSVVALSRGKQLDLVEEAIQRRTLDRDPEHGTRLHVVNAEKGLTPNVSAARLSDVLHGRGFNYSGLQKRRVLKGEYHAYQDSLPMLLETLSRLAIVEAAQR